LFTSLFQYGEIDMASIKDCVVLVTGASSGIGAACGRAFAGAGAHVILAGRRTERIEAAAGQLRAEFGVETLPITLDVTQRDQVFAVLGNPSTILRLRSGCSSGQALPARWAAIDVLVNNAGLSRGLDKLQEGQLRDWEEMIDTNLKGLLYVTRAVLPGMIARGRGHVINLGSIAGREAYPGGNVYCATKSAVAMLTRGLRIDLLGTPIRVTCIEPGMVETEFSVVRFHGDRERAARVYQGLQPLTAEEIADAILYCATRPPHVNVQDMLITPTAQASATMAHRGTSDE
jgi:serine 3-dehydrogenase